MVTNSLQNNLTYIFRKGTKRKKEENMKRYEMFMFIKNVTLDVRTFKQNQFHDAKKKKTKCNTKFKFSQKKKDI